MNYKLNTHLLDNFFDTFGTHKGADVKDCGDVYTAEFELAGFAKEDIDITATNDNLIIKAKNTKRQKEFKLNLYGAVSVDDISCDTENGLLTVTMPKKCVSEQRKIKVN
jgi:HSP20 family molecular chaperone IbpA|tara:strand:+ start:216 stop:542 length:327 start_codon:yes stop_codon:yes gene_type:complete